LAIFPLYQKQWLHAQARHYHLDPDRIRAWGFSSGGYLAALLGTTGTDDDVLMESCSHLDASIRVRAVCTYATPAELRKQQEAMTNELLAAHAPLPEGLLTSIPADCPPFLIIHGEQITLFPLIRRTSCTMFSKKRMQKRRSISFPAASMALVACHLLNRTRLWR